MRVALGLVILACAGGAAFGEAPDRAPVLTTPHFAFFSDFDTNLNDALIEAGRARKGGKAELFKSGAEAGCFGDLRAVGARRRGRGPSTTTRRSSRRPTGPQKQQYLIRVQLAGFEEELDDRKSPGVRGDRPGHAGGRGAGLSGVPMERAGREEPPLDRGTEATALGARETGSLHGSRSSTGSPGAGLPIPVDVVEVVNWSGRQFHPARRRRQGTC